MNISKSATIVVLAFLFVFATAAVYATETPNEALSEAQKFEAAGQYNFAASAYLAMAEEFDFMPDAVPALTIEQRIFAAKCAITCIEQELKQDNLNRADDFRSYLDTQLLVAARNTIKKLEGCSKRSIDRSNTIANTN